MFRLFLFTSTDGGVSTDFLSSFYDGRCGILGHFPWNTHIGYLHLNSLGMNAMLHWIIQLSASTYKEKKVQNVALGSLFLDENDFDVMEEYHNKSYWRCFKSRIPLKMKQPKEPQENNLRQTWALLQKEDFTPSIEKQPNSLKGIWSDWSLRVLPFRSQAQRKNKA